MLDTFHPIRHQNDELNLTLRAMSLAELESGRQGLQIRYGVHGTPVGPCVIATTSQGICNLAFLDEPCQIKAEKYLQIEWPNADIIADPASTKVVGDRLFQPYPDSPSALTLHVKGTDFQIQVWRSLLNIPFAQQTTYQQLAIAMGKPTAARAIGNAVGRNPVAYLIPCHRVIRQSGALGGYRWGIDRKTKLLEWESQQLALRLNLN